MAISKYELNPDGTASMWVAGGEPMEKTDLENKKRNNETRIASLLAIRGLKRVHLQLAVQLLQEAQSSNPMAMKDWAKFIDGKVAELQDDNVAVGDALGKFPKGG